MNDIILKAENLYFSYDDEKTHSLNGLSLEIGRGKKIAFMGANGVALDAGFTTPDPEEAAVKAAAVRRAREAWFLVDDSKFARVYPAVITELHGGAILTNRCPNPKYKQYTLVKETEE